MRSFYGDILWNCDGEQSKGVDCPRCGVYLTGKVIWKSLKAWDFRRGD